MSIQIATVANGEPTAPYLVRGFNAFRESCRRFGHEPLILGWAQPWRGLGSKPKLFKKALEDGTITGQYVMFVDAYDVVFTGPPEHALERFFHLRKLMSKASASLHDRTLDILWNGERSCFPRAHWAQHHPESAFPYRYFNSGASIGSAEAYLDMLEQAEVDKRPDDYQKPDGSWHHENDQDFLMEKFLFGQCGEQEPCMAVDSQCHIFQTMTEESLDNFDLSHPGCVVNKITNSTPMVIHWNGGSKTSGTMEVILNHLGL